MSDFARLTSESDSAETAAIVPLRDAQGASLIGRRTLERVRAIAEALFTTADGAPPPPRIAWLLAEFEDFLARSGGRSRLLVKIGAFAVSLLAPLIVLRFVPLSRLELRERIHALRRLESSALSGPLLAIKALLSMLYYEHPDAAAEIGFDGSCLRSDP